MELRRMTCVPVNPSAAIIKRELIQIEKKLDRLRGGSDRSVCWSGPWTPGSAGVPEAGKGHEGSGHRRGGS